MNTDVVRNVTTVGYINERMDGCHSLRKGANTRERGREREKEENVDECKEGWNKKSTVIKKGFETGLRKKE